MAKVRTEIACDVTGEVFTVSRTSPASLVAPYLYVDSLRESANKIEAALRSIVLELTPEAMLAEKHVVRLDAKDGNFIVVKEAEDYCDGKILAEAYDRYPKHRGGAIKPSGYRVIKRELDRLETIPSEADFVKLVKSAFSKATWKGPKISLEKRKAEK